MLIQVVVPKKQKKIDVVNEMKASSGCFQFILEWAIYPCIKVQSFLANPRSTLLEQGN